MKPSILYFVNHSGAGHWQRAAAILRYLEIPTVVVASDKPDYINLSSPHSYKEIVPIRAPGEVRFAGDCLHVPPLHKGQYLERINQLMDIINHHNCRYMIIDVNVELAMLARLCGIPYMYMAMHGNRTDKAHTQAFEAADSLLSSYPKILENQETPQWIVDKTMYVNGIANVDMPNDNAIKWHHDKPTVLVIKPKGYSSLTVDYIAKLASRIPQYHWYGIGFDTESAGQNYTIKPFVENALPYIEAADIVIANTGNNSVLEVGYFDKPLITKPEYRYFDEQYYKAKALKQQNLAVVLDEWPEALSEWTNILERGQTLNSWQNTIQKSAAFQAATRIKDRFSAFCSDW